MTDNSTAVLSISGQYTKFLFKGRTITFLHGKDLERYLSVKEWKDGYFVVECQGKVKGKYEDYIDMTYILENLYMDSETFLSGMKKLEIEHI